MENEERSTEYWVKVPMDTYNALVKKAFVFDKIVSGITERVIHGKPSYDIVDEREILSLTGLTWFQEDHLNRLRRRAEERQQLEAANRAVEDALREEDDGK